MATPADAADGRPILRVHHESLADDRPVGCPHAQLVTTEVPLIGADLEPLDTSNLAGGLTDVTRLAAVEVRQVVRISRCGGHERKKLEAARVMMIIRIVF
jgi:hypothetical protein